MNKKIVLKSKRLNCRYLNIDDVEKIYSMSQEEGIKRWLPDQFYQDREETRDVLNFLINCYAEVDPSQSPFVLGIELKKTNELIGHIALSPVDQIVEIGYAVEDKHQGTGYATEAVKKFSNWARKEFDLNSIWGIVENENLVSARVLEKSAYTLDKSKRDKEKKYYFFNEILNLSAESIY